MKLSSILIDVFSGYSFRKKIENEPNGEISVIQMKDLENNYQQIGSNMVKIASNKVSEKYVLQKGDVLFMAKGSNNYSVVFDKDIKAVAASAFFVLRPNQTKIIPEYLAWFINQKEAQRFIEENRAGTYVPNVNKETILNIKINVPPLDKQKIIAKLSFLQIEEYLIMNKLLLNRQLLISEKLNQSLKT